MPLTNKRSHEPISQDQAPVELRDLALLELKRRRLLKDLADVESQRRQLLREIEEGDTNSVARQGIEAPGQGRPLFNECNRDVTSTMWRRSLIHRVESEPRTLFGSDN